MLAGALGCDVEPPQGAEAEGIASLEPPVALRRLHAGAPLIDTTWGPDIERADVAAIEAVVPGLLAAQEARRAGQVASMAMLEAAVRDGRGGQEVVARVEEEIDRELELYLGDLDAVATIGAQFPAAAWRKRSEHGPAAILVLALTDHPLAREIDAFDRSPAGALSREELLLVAADRALARREFGAWRESCVRAIDKLRPLGVQQPLEPLAYRAAVQGATEAWRRWRAAAVSPFARFIATLSPTRRENLVDSGAFRGALYPTSDDVAVAPPP